MKQLNRYFFNLMTSTEKAQFISNIRAANSDSFATSYLDNFTSRDFNHFLTSAFVLSISSEGENYWRAVDEKYRNKAPENLEDKVKSLETTIEELKKENSLLVLENARLQNKLQRTKSMVNSFYGLQHPLKTPSRIHEINKDF